MSGAFEAVNVDDDEDDEATLQNKQQKHQALRHPGSEGIKIKSLFKQVCFKEKIKKRWDVLGMSHNVVCVSSEVIWFLFNRGDFMAQ